MIQVNSLGTDFPTFPEFQRMLREYEAENARIARAVETGRRVAEMRAAKEEIFETIARADAVVEQAREARALRIETTSVNSSEPSFVVTPVIVCSTGGWDDDERDERTRRLWCQAST